MNQVEGEAISSNLIIEKIDFKFNLISVNLKYNSRDISIVLQRMLHRLVNVFYELLHTMS